MSVQQFIARSTRAREHSVIAHPVQWAVAAGLAFLTLSVYGTEALGFASAGGAVALALTRVSRGGRLGADPQWHLAWCRRRGESAQTLVVRVPGSQAATAKAVVSSLRVTDSLAVRPAGRSLEVYGLLDGPEVGREVVEQRLVEALGAKAAIGWAAFPEDGLTLEALLESALSGMEREPERTGLRLPQAQFTDHSLLTLTEQEAV